MTGKNTIRLLCKSQGWDFLRRADFPDLVQRYLDAEVGIPEIARLHGVSQPNGVYREIMKRGLKIHRQLVRIDPGD